MAEAIGVASAITGLLTLAAQITKLSYTYISDFQTASKTQRSYLLEISGLSDVLLQVDSIVDNEHGRFESPVGLQIAPLVEECRAELETLKLELETQVSKEGKLKIFQADLVWPLKEKEIKKHIETIHRFRDVISNIITMNTHSLSIGTHQKMEGMRKEHVKKQISEWLGIPESVHSVAATLEDAACPGTMEWFLSSKKYALWKEGILKPLSLWCHGKPGVGKTMLSTVVLHDLQPEAPRERAIVLHHFCDFLQRDGQTTPASIKALLHQVLLQATDQQLTKLETHRSKFLTSPRLANLSSALVDVCSSHTTFLIIDALDEFEDRRNLYPILKLFSQAGWRIMITSRDLPDIRDALSSYNQIEIEAKKEDLQTYVSQRLADSDFESITSNRSIADAIVEKAGGIFLLARLIMDRLLELTTVKQMRRFLEHMPSTIHDGYVSSLDRILALPSSRSALALRLISWVTHAERRLKVSELLHAFAFEEDSDDIDEDNIPSTKLILQVCIGLVSVDAETSTLGMIHATAYQFFRTLPLLNDSHFDIATTSIGYLSLPRLSTPCSDIGELFQRIHDMPFLRYAAQFWGIHAKRVEEKAASSISSFLLDRGRISSSFQALQSGEWKSPDLAAAVFGSLPKGQQSVHIAAYWGLDSILKSILFAGGDPTVVDLDGWTPLHWAVSLEHQSTVAILLDHGVDINAPDSKGWTSLFWASFRGHAHLVVYLLSKGADHLVRDLHGWTCLHWAITRRNTSVIALLLQHHRDLSSKMTAIEVPIKTLTVSRAKELNLLRASHRRPPGDDQAPLELAAETADSGIFDILLQDIDPSSGQQAMVDDQSINSWWSSRRFDPPVSNIWRAFTKSERHHGRDAYLDEPSQGAGPKWKSRLLHVAIKDKKLHVAEMLLELGADPKDRIGWNHWTALHIATCRRDPRFVRLILARDKECISLRDVNERTALHLAAMHGFELTMKALLEYGADVNAQDKAGNTPLILACGSLRGDPPRRANRTVHAYQRLPFAIVRELLQHGADHSLCTVRGHRAIEYAVSQAAAEIVEALIVAGAETVVEGEELPILESYIVWAVSTGASDDIDRINKILAQQDSSQTVAEAAPHLAFRALKDKKWGVFRYLLSREILPVAKLSTEEATTLLLEAFRAKEDDAFQYLLDNYPTIDYPACLTPLMLDRFPKGDECSRIVSFLTLLRKVSPEAMPSSGDMTNSLHKAILETESEALIQSLIDHGADIYAPRDSNGGSYDAFLLVAATGRWTALPCLFRTYQVQPPPAHHWTSSLSMPMKLGDSDSTMIATLLLAISEANGLDNKPGLLRKANKRGDLQAVKALLSDDVEMPDEYGWTLLHWAVYEGHEDLVQFLLDRGADMSRPTTKWATSWGRPTLLYQGDNWTGQPLHIAAMVGRVAVVEQLLERGVDVNASSLNFKSTPGFRIDLIPGHGPSALRIALQNNVTYSLPGSNLDANRLRIAKMLIEKGASIEGVADHLYFDDIMRFEGSEDLWDRLRVGMSPGGKTTTVHTRDPSISQRDLQPMPTIN